MSGNVGCYAGDSSPVVGQCSGYQGTCGQFYCANHTVDKLCGACGGKKQADEEVQRRFEDYLATAERIKRPQAIGAGVFNVILAFVGIGFILGGIVQPSWGGKIVFLLIGGGALFSIITMSSALTQQQKVFKARLEETEKLKPGFKEFYQAWQSDRSKEQLKTIAAVTLAVAGTGVEMHQAHKQKQMRQDLHEVNETLKKLK